MNKVSLRKCIVTHKQFPKKELIRVVLLPDGKIQVDPSGKKQGRGAYIKRDKDIVLEAQAKDLLSRSLRKKVPSELYNELIQYV